MKQFTILILALVFALTGCVGKSTYEKKVSEAEQLAAALQTLQQKHTTRRKV